MRQVSYGLMIAGTVLTSVFILPLAWMIPLTVLTKKQLNNPKPSIALGVCCILFAFIFGLVAGILLLIQDDSIKVEEGPIINTVQPNISN
ncbi:hypothetical protein SSYRP_v1c03360 [Spiroplasma syrphidicola EA-1]|uniref:Transmembrane protein n=1 Tax=Spiroplasma syrphidicola EA-1 TaxID=1276229 RepID=R4UID7_9MOLU|nr:hypothetical protein [Spiroplasma syrphidicola]AGM25930.1 hypothetical protein SSYRP_v1c03360 [Spiroplasma syrphidicola EA-1]